MGGGGVVAAGAQQLLILSVGQFVGLAVPASRIGQPFPERQVAAELAFVVFESGVLLIGLGLGIDGPVSNVLNGQGTGDHQHLVQGTPLAGL